MMNIKSFLITIFGALTFSTSSVVASESENFSWDTIIRTASLISNNSQDVVELLELAREDKDLMSETSEFNQKMKTVLKKNGINLDDFASSIYEVIDDENTEELPYAIFKAVMAGFDFMSIADWKDIIDSENMVWLVNTQFKSKKIKQLTQAEISSINNSVSSLLTEPYSAKEEVMATNNIIKTISDIVSERDYRVLWYHEESDSVQFCIVKPEVYKQLNNTKLGFDHEFKVPQY